MRGFYRWISAAFCLSRTTSGFRCFSEYEFNWWDGAGDEHINGFSMSHFQLKMRSYFAQTTTNRLPIKEANFLVRLHPTYRKTLVSDCPHALISAHLLMAWFTADSQPAEVSQGHYEEAMKILNETARIHQEVTLYAWPLTQLLDVCESSLRVPQSLVDASVRSVVIFGLRHRPAFLRSLAASAAPPSTRRLLIDSRDQEYVDQSMTGGFKSIQFLFSNSSMCSVQDAVLAQLPEAAFPVIFLDLSESFSEPLLFQYLNFLRFRRGTVVPPFYSFGQRRTIPDENIKGSYDSSSFAISSKSLIFEKLNSVSPLCSQRGIWENSLKSTTKLHFPLRCDDAELPVSLRLCGGDEHTRTDWRDTILAPVLPRHPVL